MRTNTHISKVKKILVPTGNLVFSTSSDKGKVHVCIMSWVLSDNNCLLLSCEKNSSKIDNITSNPRVGMTIYEKQENPSLLMYGTAAILEKEKANLACKEILKKAPHYKAFTNKDRCFIKVKIEKIIYEFYGKDESEYFELSNNIQL